jgi:hypothetical protein
VQPEDYIDDYNIAESIVYLSEEPEEQAQEIKAERGKVLASAPIFEDLNAWFDDEIAWAKSIDGLDVESNSPIEAQILAKQRYATFMESAKLRVNQLKNAHIED